MRIVQVAPSITSGDAIGNEMIELYGHFKSKGHESRLCYLQHKGNLPGVNSSDVFFHDELGVDPEDIVIMHESVGSETSQKVHDLECKKIFKYHNITPAKFVEKYDSVVARESLAMGRARLSNARGRYNLYIGDSKYNASELERLGMTKTMVIPVITDYQRLATKDSIERGSGTREIIFVGRVIPNKRQDDLIRAFHVYNKYICGDSRLSLVGGPLFGSSDIYWLELQQLIKRLGLQTSVIMSGHVSDNELSQYYQKADLLLCMSEHEGFCVPLLEAMHVGIPILARDFAAVGETLGSAGVKFKSVDYADLSEMMNLLIEDDALRTDIIQGQRERLQHFSRERILSLWDSVLNRFV